jgi:hypothetical protein
MYNMRPLWVVGAGGRDREGNWIKMACSACTEKGEKITFTSRRGRRL